jgi:hypothetical protein
MVRAAFISGIATVGIGLTIGVPGYFAFAEGLADANNTWMLRQLAGPQTAATGSVGLVPYGMSVITLFIFVFLTPIGLLSTYVVGSGFVRAVGGWFDDPRGDFLLSAVAWLATTARARYTRDRQRIERERREGADRPDVLKTGEWARIDADFVVLSARRKAEWTAGAIVMSGDDWYRLGVPYDLDTPFGLRTAYPLKKLDTVEVVRRGILYELPPLSGRAAAGRPDA